MKKVLRKFLISLKNNAKSIITAVIASTVIWFAISLQLFPDIKRNISDIPVSIFPTQYMIENDLLIDESYGFSASIQIEGKRYAIGGLTSDDFFAELDLSHVDMEGEYEVDIIVYSDTLIDYEITSTAQTARIKVERIASKELTVAAKADNIRVTDGMQIDVQGLSAYPNTVIIRGEKNLIDSITRAEVQAVYSMEMLETTNVIGELILFNDNVRVENPGISVNSENFTVTVPVHMLRTLPLEFQITRHPNNFDIADFRSKMAITPREIILSAPDTSIENLISFEVGHIALADVTLSMLTDITRDTIQPKLPEGYKNVSGEAAFALQFIGVGDYIQEEFLIPAERLVVINRPSGFKAEILTREITLSVIGPASYIETMSADDITINIDLAGIELTTDTRIISRSVQYRIRGTKIPAWVVGYPQVDVSFSRIE